MTLRAINYYRYFDVQMMPQVSVAFKGGLKVLG